MPAPAPKRTVLVRSGIILMMTGVLAEAQEKRQPSERELLLKLSRQTIDKLKSCVDEWGTLTLAPPLLVPPRYYREEDRGKDGTITPQWPFELKEKNPGDAAYPFTLDKLYAEMNEANGSSRFGQRTLTRTQLAAELSTNAVAEAVVGEKLKVLSASQAKQEQGSLEKLNLARETLDSALRRQSQLRTAAVTTASTVPQASQEVEAARAAWNAARNAAVGLPEAELPAASARVAAAQENLTKADARLTLARAHSDNARNLLMEANKAVRDARAELVTVQGQQLPNTTTLPDAKARPSVSVDLPSPQDLRAASGAADIAKVGTEEDKTPDLPKTLAPAKTEAGGQAEFPPLERLNAAASALTVQRILRFLGKPEAAVDFDGKRLLFAVSTLSVNPGWRTKKDFKAVIDAQFTLELGEGAAAGTIRELLNCPDYPVSVRRAVAKRYPQHCTAGQRAFFGLGSGTGRADENLIPLADYLRSKDETNKLFDTEAQNIVVTAVSPMVDSQNLDLASSIARQDEIALFLSAAMAQAGSAGAANFFTSWVKTRKKEVATRSTLATTNSYSLGDHFGFEVGTRLRGLDDDDAKGDKAAQTLDRQTIPVLFLIGIPESVARPMIQRGNDGRIVVREPVYKLAYSTRWARHSHGFWSFLKTNRSPSQSAREIVENAVLRRNTVAALPKDEEGYVNISESAEEAVVTMESEFDSIIKQLYGETYTDSLPGRWLLNNMGANQRTDAGLADDEAVVRQGKVMMEMEPPQFSRVGASAVVTLTGPEVHLLDGGSAVVAGEGLSRAPDTKVFQSGDRISVPVQALGQGNGKATLVIPYRAEAAQRTAFEIPILFSIAEPLIFDWRDEEKTRSIRAVVSEKMKTASLRVIIRGTGLDRLRCRQAISRNKCSIKTSSVEPGAMLLDVSFPEIVSDDDSLQFLLEVQDDPQASIQQTQPLKLQFITTK